MTFKLKHFSYNSQLFADGGDGATGASEGSMAVSPTATEGSNDNAQLAQVQEARDLNAEFEELIKGEFKDVYGKKVRAVVGDRLKGKNELISKYKALEPTLQFLAERYGVDPMDSESLSKAIQDDDIYYEQAAMEAGVSVDQFKQMRKLELANARLQKQIDESNAQAETDKLYHQWMQEAETIKQIYPTFDLDALLDLGNESEEANTFRGLLGKPGITMRSAYEVANLNNIMGSAMNYAAQQTEQKVINSVIANRQRPTENGLGTGATATTVRDVASLTKEERQELIRRATQGEAITLRGADFKG